MPSPRTFTPRDLSTLTEAELAAMSPEDQLAFSQALLALWSDPSHDPWLRLEGDYDMVGSNRRFEIGE